MPRRGSTFLCQALAQIQHLGLLSLGSARGRIVAIIARKRDPPHCDKPEHRSNFLVCPVPDLPVDALKHPCLIKAMPCALELCISVSCL